MTVEQFIAQTKAKLSSSHIVATHQVAEDIDNEDPQIRVKVNLARSVMQDAGELTNMIRDLQHQRPRGYSIRFDITMVL